MFIIQFACAYKSKSSLQWAESLQIHWGQKATHTHTDMQARTRAHARTHIHRWPQFGQTPICIQTGHFHRNKLTSSHILQLSSHLSSPSLSFLLLHHNHSWPPLPPSFFSCSVIGCCQSYPSNRWAWLWFGVAGRSASGSEVLSSRFRFWGLVGF